jgi:5'-methylthioadenosine phosphorylase
MSKTAIIGGKGLSVPDYLNSVKELSVNTPFGIPDPVIYSGIFDGVEVIHLSRYGKEKAVPPSRINYRANLYALKQLDCRYILATSTCRSLQEEICPGEIIILDQFIDMTTQQLSGIYDDLKTLETGSLPMGDPFSEELRDHLVEAAIVMGITVHTKGIILSIEGPRLSSRAESNLFRNWGADVINRVTTPEVILANELGIPYAALALCTGYDSWRINDDASGEQDGEAILVTNREKMIRMLTYAVRKIEQHDQGEL